MTVKRYANTAGGNNVSGTGNGFMAEGIPPSTVNDAYRQFQANVRVAFNDFPWVDVGSLGQAANEAGFVFASSNSIQDSSGVDLTQVYKRGRRIRCVGTSTGDIVGVISGASFSSPNNTITILFDSGSLVNESLQIFLGPNLDTAFPAPIIRQIFTSSGTWTKPAGLKRALIHVIGAGGAGGGAGSTTGSTASEGGGGGGGGYANEMISASGLGSTETVTVGAGGTGVSGNNPGNAGGTTSFGTSVLLQATGGAGGAGSAGNSSGLAIRRGGDGGVGSGGDLNFNGGDGEDGRLDGTDRFFSGAGGASGYFGSRLKMGGGGSGNDGIDGRNPGDGGTGAQNSTSQAGRAGGDGADGLVIVEEFFV